MIEPYRGVLPEIHPTAYVHPTAVIIGEVQLGAGCSVWPGAVIRGDMGPIVLGENTNVQDNAVLHNTGGRSTTRVGARVTIGHRAILHGCIIGDDVLVGMGSIVMDSAVIGSGSVVAAGALVSMNKSFDPGVLLLGSPAVVARPVRPAEIDWIEHSWTAYLETASAYRSKHSE